MRRRRRRAARRPRRRVRHGRGTPQRRGRCGRHRSRPRRARFRDTIQIRLPAHGRPEGPRALRRQRHAPAPHHPHERQAAGAGGQQARALLRARGDGRGGHPPDRHHHRSGDRRRDPRGRRRRLAVRRRDHLYRAGRAEGPRACRADRRGVPRRLALRHVPGRQPAEVRAGRARRDVQDQRPRRADPADSRARPRELRRRRARRRPHQAPRGEAQGPAVGPRAGRHLHVQAVDLRRGPLDRALVAGRAGDHRRDPDARRPRPARGAAHRARMVEGHGPARGPARGQPADPRGPRRPAPRARSSTRASRARS